MASHQFELLPRFGTSFLEDYACLLVADPKLL